MRVRKFTTRLLPSENLSRKTNSSLSPTLMSFLNQTGLFNYLHPSISEPINSPPLIAGLSRNAPPYPINLPASSTVQLQLKAALNYSPFYGVDQWQWAGNCSKNSRSRNYSQDHSTMISEFQKQPAKPETALLLFAL